MEYNLAGRSANTAATANHCAAQVWNPSTTRPMWVTAIALSQRAATVSNIAVKRSSARGATPATSVTSAASNDLDGDAAPPTVCVAEFGAFGTQPTLTGNVLFQWNNPASIGSGFIVPFANPNRHGLKIGPASGLCIYTPDAVILQASDITFFCFE
jgi:hypothetical protein